MPMSSAAAVVKILKMEPAPSPTSENGCGCTVSLASLLNPYVRLLAIAITRCASLPGCDHAHHAGDAVQASGWRPCRSPA